MFLFRFYKIISLLFTFLIALYISMFFRYHLFSLFVVFDLTFLRLFYIFITVLLIDLYSIETIRLQFRWIEFPNQFTQRIINVNQSFTLYFGLTNSGISYQIQYIFIIIFFQLLEHLLFLIYNFDFICLNSISISQSIDSQISYQNYILNISKT